MTVGRRGFIGSAGATLAFTVAGQQCLLSPREAHAQGVATTVLTEQQAKTLASLGDALVEGASEAGLVEFIDQQLTVSPSECLLSARFFNVEPPYAPFYQGCLDTLASWTRQRTGGDFLDLPAAEKAALIGEIAQGMPSDWQGPPAPLLYLLVRSDAVDVVWGTPEGFDSLNIPYMAHIMPPTKW